MKRNIFTLLMVFVLALGTAALMAQTTNPQVPPSQQVDQSGQPEQGTGVDVDVDAGANAKNGVLNVDVDRNTDSDTAAEPGDTAATGTHTTATGSTYDNNAGSNTAGDNDSLPDTASDMPLLGLLGLLSLAGACVLRYNR